MDQRERWQALQSRLSAARALVDAGDRTRALDEIDAALAIDPEFLAAHSLRDRVLAPPESAAAEQITPVEGPVLPQSRPLVSAEGYAKFEARAKRRRVDRRIDAARSAIERRRLHDAATALDEIIELDPNIPELAELTAAFENLRRGGEQPHRGPLLAAAAAFAIVFFSASWLQEWRPLASNPVAVAPRVESAELTPLVTTEIADAAIALAAVSAPATSIGTSGGADRARSVGFEAREPDASRAVEPESRATDAESPRVPTSEIRAQMAESRFLQRVASPEPVSVPALSEPLTRVHPERRVEGPALSEPLTRVHPERRVEGLAPVAAAVAPPAPPAPSVDDGALVNQALQRYRAAYDGLDAQSAQTVFPAVNRAALARAFDGLESQLLTFDACYVQLSGEAATATCRGSARYVPKVGSREPHTEPRIWNFTLRKAGPDWKIESARADR